MPLTPEEQAALEQEALAGIYEGLGNQANALADVGNSIADIVGSTLDSNARQLRTVTNSINSQSNSVLDQQESSLADVAGNINSQIESVLAENAIRLPNSPYLVPPVPGPWFAGLFGDEHSFPTLDKAFDYASTLFVMPNLSDPSGPPISQGITVDGMLNSCVGCKEQIDALSVDVPPDHYVRYQWGQINIYYSPQVQDNQTVPTEEPVDTGIGEPAPVLKVSPDASVEQPQRCCPVPVDWDQPVALAFSHVADKWMDKVNAYYPQIPLIKALGNADGIDAFLRDTKPPDISKPEEVNGDEMFGQAISLYQIGRPGQYVVSEQ